MGWVLLNCKLSPQTQFSYGSSNTPAPSFPRREDVDRSNSTRINRLHTSQHTFHANDGGTIVDPAQREKMLANFMAPKVLGLRVDAQVMLIKNMDDSLVNGSMGKVVRFADPAFYGGVEDDEGAGGAGAGAGKRAAGVGQVEQFPVVEFALPGGGKREIIVMRENWKVELPNGEVQVSRTQVINKDSLFFLNFSVLSVEDLMVSLSFAVTAYSRMGDVDPQISRTDVGAR